MHTATTSAFQVAPVGETRKEFVLKDSLTKLLITLGFFGAICSTQPTFASEQQSVDLMSFAQGALPVLISTGEADLRIGMEHAIAAIDGNPEGYVATPKPALTTDIVEITYSLPALTRFERFAVPNVLETPSPFQTFFKRIGVLGSAVSADGPFELLGQGDLQVHDDRGLFTELTLSDNQPEVRWVRLRLQDGVDVQKDKSFFEFSELIANGKQQDQELSDGYSGVWKGRGVKLELAQDGATVSGCYDGNSTLSGTVQGNILRALGKDQAGVPSQFILIAAENGAIRGLRSTNGAPFKPYDGDHSDNAPSCLEQEPPKLGCGSIVHGIGFDFDSDNIRPTSRVIIADLHDGLLLDGGKGIQIIGHSSSEGAQDYNRDLSQRRAQSVVAALVALGIDPSQISATGRGEDDPIASNDVEAGRSLNRRVEVQCAD